MITELSEYYRLVTASQAVGGKPDLEMINSGNFWAGSYNVIPNLALLARFAFSISTSSAAAERVFSCLNASFDRNQELALEDYVELAIMLQFNGR